MCDWIPGTLELTSKVRYGITSKGVPIFRFIPYDKLHRPLAVSCSQRDLFHNIHAIVQPGPAPEKAELQKGVLIQNLGQPTPESEVAVLLGNYAYDCQKDLRPSKAQRTALTPSVETQPRTVLEGFTFNIDPPGCRDVDDSFTLKQIAQHQWQISINIADVASLIEEGSDLDIQARRRATSFYSPTGECLAPMFPPEVVEAASLGSDDPRPTLSLQFVYGPDGMIDFKWVETLVTRSRSFTYDEADALLHKYTELQVIKDMTKGDSHKWVQQLMILYNQKAGEALKARSLGILRSHSAPAAEELAQLTAIDPSFGILAYEAATFCLPSESTKHFGLETDAYAYASSPIRRYCDLVNQRALKGLTSWEKQKEELVNHLNRRQKQAKAFSRDFFFMTELSKSNDCVEGTVIAKAKEKCKIYVPVWKRTIKVRLLNMADAPAPGTKVSIEWYDDREKPNWKERIVFKIR